MYSPLQYECVLYFYYMSRSAISYETTLTVGADLARKVTSRRNLFEAGSFNEVEDIKAVKNVALVAHNVKCVCQTTACPFGESWSSDA